MDNEVKTLYGWCEFSDRTGKGSWYEYAEVGSVVAEAVVDSFLDMLPPRSMKYGYVQVGEAYSHIEDENGTVRATYMTFAKLDGVWKYCGNCFAGEIVDRS